ncbi:MAG: hypothetical protein II329_01890, partial [Clostridia bacterium]|nr:hypothetical protein [Clostridia bacterium]
DRNEAKNGFWEGRCPFPKNPQPSPAKPPDIYGRFCSRRDRNAAGTASLVLRTEVMNMRTNRKE